MTGFGLGIPPRLHIGEDVGAAEAVDRLLGITDHEEAAIGASAIDRAEDAVLHRIRILELIDHGQRVAFPDASDESLSALPLQRLVQLVEEVVKEQHPLL